jgi:hypothetical protein
MIDKNELLKRKLLRLRDENPHASFASLWQRVARENPELIPSDDSSGSAHEPSSHGDLETDQGKHYDISRVALAILSTMTVPELIQASMEGRLTELNEQAHGGG